MTTLQVQAKALGDPTRYRIFQFVAESATPVGVKELASYFGLHHNAIRQHLSRLRDAALVDELTEERHEPGRPRLLYRLAGEAADQWAPGGPYQRLAELLLEVISSGADPREVGREAGRRLACDEVKLPATGLAREEAIAALEAVAARQGFRPSRREAKGAVELVFGRCPIAGAAEAHPGIVCAVHLGLTEGVAGEVGGVTVERLLAEPPARAGCRLVLS